MVTNDLQLGESHQDKQRFYQQCRLLEYKQQKKWTVTYVELVTEVEPDQYGLQCDFCETWEHVKCIRRPDTIPDKLYATLVESRSKPLLFCGITCRRKGSVVKQLYKLQSDLVVADEQQLASMPSKRHVIVCVI